MQCWCILSLPDGHSGFHIVIINVSEYDKHAQLATQQSTEMVGVLMIVTMMKMMMICVVVDGEDEHLGYTPGPPYSLPDLSRFGIRSTSARPNYDRRWLNNNRRQNQKTMNDKVVNAYLDNAKHSLGSSLKMEDSPPNPKHNVYEKPKPKGNQIHPFFETTSFNPVVSFKENPLPKKSFVHKEPEMEKIQDMFFSYEVHDVQSFTLADAKTTNIQNQHEQLFKKHLDVSRYPARTKTIKTPKLIKYHCFQYSLQSAHCFFS
jgi:hypothetical protein